jgi:hypothetical protein
MSIEKLKQELSLISSDNWMILPSHNSNCIENVKWLPLLKISDENYLGIVEEGFWAKYSGMSVTVFESKTPLVFLLPCLEIKYDTFLKMLENGLSMLKLSKELSNTFPSSDLVCMGLNMDSDYWSKLALEWAEKLYIDERLSECLSFTIKSGITQEIRQKAKKLLRLRSQA